MLNGSPGYVLISKSNIHIKFVLSSSFIHHVVLNILLRLTATSHCRFRALVSQPLIPVEHAELVVQVVLMPELVGVAKLDEESKLPSATSGRG